MSYFVYSDFTRKHSIPRSHFVLVLVTVATMKPYDQKSYGEEWVYFTHSSMSSKAVGVATQAGCEPKPGVSIEDMEAWPLLDCSFWLAQPAF